MVFANHCSAKIRIKLCNTQARPRVGHAHRHTRVAPYPLLFPDPLLSVFHVSLICSCVMSPAHSGGAGDPCPRLGDCHISPSVPRFPKGSRQSLQAPCIPSDMNLAVVACPSGHRHSRTPRRSLSAPRSSGLVPGSWRLRRAWGRPRRRPTRGKRAPARQFCRPHPLA